MANLDLDGALIHHFLTQHPVGQAMAAHTGYGPGSPTYDQYAGPEGLPLQLQAIGRVLSQYGSNPVMGAASFAGPNGISQGVPPVPAVAPGSVPIDLQSIQGVPMQGITPASSLPQGITPASSLPQGITPASSLPQGITPIQQLQPPAGQINFQATPGPTLQPSGVQNLGAAAGSLAGATGSLQPLQPTNLGAISDSLGGPTGVNPVNPGSLGLAQHILNQGSFSGRVGSSPMMGAASFGNTLPTPAEHVQAGRHLGEALGHIGAAQALGGDQYHMLGAASPMPGSGSPLLGGSSPHLNIQSSPLYSRQGLMNQASAGQALPPVPGK